LTSSGSREKNIFEKTKAGINLGLLRSEEGKISERTQKWRKILDYVAINYGGKHSSAIAATVLIASRQSPLPQSEQIIFD